MYVTAHMTQLWFENHPTLMYCILCDVKGFKVSVTTTIKRGTAQYCLFFTLYNVYSTLLHADTTAHIVYTVWPGNTPVYSVYSVTRWLASSTSNLVFLAARALFMIPGRVKLADPQLQHQQIHHRAYLYCSSDFCGDHFLERKYQDKSVLAIGGVVQLWALIVHWTDPTVDVWSNSY